MPKKMFGISRICPLPLNLPFPLAKKRSTAFKRTCPNPLVYDRDVTIGKQQVMMECVTMSVMMREIKDAMVRDVESFPQIE